MQKIKEKSLNKNIAKPITALRDKVTTRYEVRTHTRRTVCVYSLLCSSSVCRHTRLICKVWNAIVNKLSAKLGDSWQNIAAIEVCVKRGRPSGRECGMHFIKLSLFLFFSLPLSFAFKAKQTGDVYGDVCIFAPLNECRHRVSCRGLQL